MARKSKTGLHKREDSPYWYASYVDPRTGKTRKRSTGEAEKKRARKKLDEWRLGLDQPEQTKSALATVGELLELYTEKLLQRNKSSACPSSYGPLMTVLGPEPLPLTPTAINLYVVERMKYVSSATVHQNLTFLSAAINWANRELETDLPNPVPGRKPAKAQPRTRFFSRAEIAALLDESERSVQAYYMPDLIRLCLYAGLRVGEALKLTWAQIDWTRRVITFRPDQQKSARSPGEVPINNHVLELLRARNKVRDIRTDLILHRNSLPIKHMTITYVFRDLAAKAGIEDVMLRDLRRTCGTWLIQAGVPLPEVSKFLRHADIGTTLRTYAHLSPEQVRAAASVLDKIVEI